MRGRFCLKERHEQDHHGPQGWQQKPRQPVEMPDSVRSIARAKILLALGEGEFDGGVDGRSIYLDDTPLLAADGSVNFPE